MPPPCASFALLTHGLESYQNTVRRIGLRRTRRQRRAMLSSMSALMWRLAPWVFLLAAYVEGRAAEPTVVATYECLGLGCENPDRITSPTSPSLKSNCAFTLIPLLASASSAKNEVKTKDPVGLPSGDLASRWAHLAGCGEPCASQSRDLGDYVIVRGVERSTRRSTGF